MPAARPPRGGAPPQRVRGGIGKRGGHDNDLVLRAARPPRGWGRGGGHDDNLVSCGQHDHHVEARGTTKIGVPTSAPQPPQRVRGGMGKGGRGGGHDNDLVSRCQRNHIQQPVPQRVRGGREGEGGGADNDLLSRGQHDHIQSPAPQPTGLQTTLLEVVSFFVGGCFMCPEQGTGEGWREGWASTGI